MSNPTESALPAHQRGYARLKTQLSRLQNSKVDRMEVIDYFEASSVLMWAAPVFGNQWVNKIHNCLLASLTVYMIVESFLMVPEADSVCEKFELPSAFGKALFLMPFCTTAIFVQVLLARRLLKEPYLVVQIRDVLEEVPDANVDPEARPLQRLESGRRWVQWLTIVSLFFPILLLLVLYGCAHLLGEWDSLIFWRLVVPFAIAWPYATTALLAVALAIYLMKYSIEKFTKKLLAQVNSEGEGLYEGFFHNLVKEYFHLDHIFVRTCSAIGNNMLCLMSMLFACGYACALIALWKDIALGLEIGAILCCGICFLAMLVMMFPLAHLSDSCHSTHTHRFLGEETSLHLSILRCAELPMTPEIYREYKKLEGVVEKVPLGVKFPLLGLLRVDNLVSCLKLIVTVVPILMTSTLTAVRDD